MRFLFALTFLSALALPYSLAANAQDIAVQVAKNGGVVTVEAKLFAPVDIRIAWQVLCDFDQMAKFVPSIEQSRIISKPGEPLLLEQRGFARFGPFGVAFDTVRSVELVPHRVIKTRMLSGNMRRLEATMELAPAAGGTRMAYHAEVEPDFWLPPLLGPVFIRRETEEQLGAMIAEMKRRGAVPGKRLAK